jgi:hypothetical protein
LLHNGTKVWTNLGISSKLFFADIIKESMKDKAYLIAVVYLFFAVSNSLYSVGEKTITLGGDTIRKVADYTAGIAELNFVRSKPVLALSSSRSVLPGISSPDMALSFDEGKPEFFRDSAGNYQMIVSPPLAAVDNFNARAGSGAAFFSGNSPEDKRTTAAGGPLIVRSRNNNALFSANSRFYDFTLEFWLNPLKLENGERIVLWTSALPASPVANYMSQHILCESSKNRLQWSFFNFFFSPDGAKTININIGGVSAVVPKTWSHHLIRFDSATGMIEYLVDGKTESIEYVTSTGRERGEVYTPITGEGGIFTLGGGFLGMMDEFRIHGSHIPNPAVRKYPLNGGRIETKAIDLGEGSNGVLKLEASGGKTSLANTSISSEYRRNGRFRFSDDSEMQFFIRSSNNPYRWDIPWKPVIPGADLDGTVHGRYVQLAVDFYPSASGETTPYLEELCITYLPDEPPLPPAQITAVAMDGSVQLRWKSSPDQKTQGYLVYYGTSSDDYFSEDAALGSSPIDAGKQNEIRIDGLKNGTLYYFRVAAYSRKNNTAESFYTAPYHAGELSREVRARPLR